MPAKEGTGQSLKEFISSRRQMQPDQQIGESRAVISAIDSINTDDAYRSVKSRISGINRRSVYFEQFRRIAAILFFPLLLVSVLYFLSLKDKSRFPEMSVQQLTSPAGVRSQVTLPDGTQVWLNGESTIKYSLPFNNQTRNVDLEGEAFFDVTRNPKSPFLVSMPHATVRVLGTMFNCKAYPGEKTEVTLAKGKVRLGTDPVNSEKKDYILSPGEHAVINSTGQIKINKENIDKYIAWHTGFLVFDDSPLPEVVEKLERWYGVDVSVRDTQLLSSRITTTFENEPLRQVLELLELASPLKIDYVPATINTKTGEQVKSKVIISGKTN